MLVECDTQNIATPTTQRQRVVSIHDKYTDTIHYDYLQKACDIMLKYKKEDTICAVVRNIGRDGESKKILSLKELRGYEADMFTTVFVGNRATKVINGAMVTPRGYVL